MIEWLVFDGVTAPSAPTAYIVSTNDLDGEGTTRNERGVMVNRDRLRADVYQIEAKYRIKSSEIASFGSMLLPKQITVKFYDSTTGEYKTKIMYAAQKRAEIIYSTQTPGETLCDYSFTLTEC